MRTGQVHRGTSRCADVGEPPSLPPLSKPEWTGPHGTGAPSGRREPGQLTAGPIDGRRRTAEDPTKPGIADPLPDRLGRRVGDS
ncbi:MAG: hypothetical protein GEU99_19035 [Luteitalea sp.]|nr:hypothetical protein [Luteitalea sp.]